ncbi:MAG: pyruvate kinase [Bacteroidia bacterium]
MKNTFNRTKIIATLGPATSSRKMLEKLIRAGVNVCRINLSHGNHEAHAKIIEHIRAINIENNFNTGILVDLQGPKLRVGDITDNKVNLKQSQELVLTTESFLGTADKVYVKYPSFVKDIAVGDPILIDDGKLELIVTEKVSGTAIKTRVVHGGPLSSNKGINLPYTRISLPSLTEKDIKDLDFALQQDVEWIGLSFVRSAKDIVQLKKIIKDRKKKARVIAKIEKPEAIKDIDNIIIEADALMVARGDLGVEMQMEQVPLIQKMLVKKCIKASKPIIIATQMMESMINSITPTRAEVNDVGNSVMDGADALMLSGETSVGKYPVEVVEYMKRIISMVENEESIYNHTNLPDPDSHTFVSDSICFSACKLAEQAGARAIVAMTHSGYTAFKISSHRPKAHIFIYTDNRPILNTLSLVWGVRGFFYDRYVSTDETISDLKEHLKRENYVEANDIAIHVASIPISAKGRTNMLKINKIG